MERETESDLVTTITILVKWHSDDLLLLFNRPPVREVCLNHVVTKPHTETYPDLGSVVYCYVAILYAPPRLLSSPYNFRTVTIYYSTYGINDHKLVQGSRNKITIQTNAFYKILEKTSHLMYWEGHIKTRQNL